MKPLFAAGWALGGAALAASMIYLVPALQPGHLPEAAEEEESSVPAPAAGGLSLDKNAVAHAGLRFVTLQPAASVSEKTGFARALDLTPLAAISAEIQSARAALAASEAEARRQAALAAQDQSASVRAVELARAQAQADRARVTLALRRAGLEYGSGLSGREGQLDGLVAQAAHGEAALIRLDFEDGAPPAGVAVTITDGDIRLLAQVIGPAVGADPNLQSAGVLAIVHGPVARSLAVGRVMRAVLPGLGPVQKGVVVPRSSIVRTQGGLWVYRVEQDGTFRRVELQSPVAHETGWFVRKGLRPGDRIVSAGATALLGLEAGPPAEEE